MSSAENSSAPTGEDDTAMSSADLKFLVSCLKNATGGSISIDYVAVAEELNYQNHRSVANKAALLKKKYGLPLGGGGKNSKASAAAGPNQPAIPKTPTKDRVTKSRATPKKATPKSSKGKNAVKSEEMVKFEDDDDEMDEEDKARYEEVFGQTGDSDEAGESDDDTYKA